MITVTGKGVNTGNLLRFGRGQYLVALRYMEKSPERSGSNGMMVNYYKRYLARPDSVRYANGATLNDRGAEWLILHRFELTKRPPRELTITGINTNRCVFTDTPTSPAGIGRFTIT